VKKPDRIYQYIHTRNTDPGTGTKTEQTQSAFCDKKSDVGRITNRLKKGFKGQRKYPKNFRFSMILKLRKHLNPINSG